MTLLEAIILGIVQGLTEFLPVSSDGHFMLAKALLGIDLEKSLSFLVVIHFGTSLSTIVVFRKEIGKILTGLFAFRWNDEWKFAVKVLVGMIPLFPVYFLLKDELDALFSDSLLFTGMMLCLTGSLLVFSHFAPSRNREVSFLSAFLIGIAQTAAVLPGLSRSGSTISTGLMLGIEKSKLTTFSFLMVLPAILGGMTLEAVELAQSPEKEGLPFLIMASGFLAAFIVGLVACSWMINLIRKQKLIYFGVYCLLAGLVTIYLSWS